MVRPSTTRIIPTSITFLTGMRGPKTRMASLKIDLHTHTAEDAMDKGFKHDARQLIDRAKELGFGALAVSNHRIVTYDKALAEHAKKKGILLIPGCEAEIEGKHTLIYNITEKERAAISTFDDLRKLRAKKGKTMLVIAPHPTFPHGRSLTAARVRSNADCFDAIELSQFHWYLPNFNNAARRLAKELGKPAIATSDAHSFHFFGRHYAMVDVNTEKHGTRTQGGAKQPAATLPSVQDVLDAIRANRIQNVSKPIRFIDGLYLVWIAAGNKVLSILGLPGHRAF